MFIDTLLIVHAPIKGSADDDYDDDDDDDDDDADYDHGLNTKCLKAARKQSAWFCKMWHILKRFNFIP